MRILIFCFFVLFLPVKGWGQPVQSDFSIPPQACLQENIYLANQSTGATSYEWDLCSGELALNPTASVLINSYGGYGTKVDVVEQGGQYYGFFIGRAVGKLFRLDFGTDISLAPQLVDLGGFGINSPNWRAVEIVKEGINYYGFIIDSNLNVVYRFSLGLSLTNSPSALEIIYSGNLLSSPIDITSVEDGTLKFIFIANLGNEKLVRIKFNQSYADLPSNLAIDFVTVAGSVLLGGISFIQEGIKWYCLASSVATFQVYKIEFITGLTDTSPSITNFGVSAPVGLALVNDNGQNYAFVQSQNSSSSIFRVNFGNSLANVPIGIDELKNIGLAGSNLWGFSMFKAQSKWLTLSTETAGSTIFRITFPNNCFSNVEYSTAFQPNVVAVNAGTYSVTLSAKDLSGQVSTQSKSIMTLGNLAPDIDFTSQNICSGNPVNFTFQNTSGNITDYTWDFGDSNTSGSANPTHQYTAAGTYPIQLNVTATNGCHNLARDTIKIYTPPHPHLHPPPRPHLHQQRIYFPKHHYRQL